MGLGEGRGLSCSIIIIIILKDSVGGLLGKRDRKGSEAMDASAANTSRARRRRSLGGERIGVGPEGGAERAVGGEKGFKRLIVACDGEFGWFFCFLGLGSGGGGLEIEFEGTFGFEVGSSVRDG